jgi:hypothetical protein
VSDNAQEYIHRNEYDRVTRELKIVAAEVKRESQLRWQLEHLIEQIVIQQSFLAFEAAVERARLYWETFIKNRDKTEGKT